MSVCERKEGQAMLLQLTPAQPAEHKAPAGWEAYLEAFDRLLRARGSDVAAACDGMRAAKPAVRRTARPTWRQKPRRAAVALPDEFFPNLAEYQAGA